MTILADPQLCPSCRHALPPGGLVCTSCQLDLRGGLGVRLFAVLTEADHLIAQMRTAAAAPVHAPSSHGRSTSLPGPSPSAPRGVSAATVPAVLLGLGALCVLVAAGLFLPFAWELLGVLGRTLVLVAVTAGAVVATRLAAGRGLRSTAEALGVVSSGLVTFDLVGARSSGWFGDISDSGFAVVLGAALLLTGTVAALWLRLTPIGVLVGGELVAVVGGAVLATGAAGLEVGTVALRLGGVVALLAAIATATGALRVDRPGVASMATATRGHLAVAATTWAVLGLSGVATLGDGLSWSAMWPGGAGMTLLLTGVLAALPALDRRRSVRMRVACLSVALAPWTLLLTAPAYDEGPDQRTSAVLVVLLVCLLAAPRIARPWRACLLPVGALSTLGSSLLVAPLAGLAIDAVVGTVLPLWAGSAGDRAAPAETGDWAGSWGAESLPTPWALPAVCLALALALATTVRSVGSGSDPDGRRGTGSSSLGVLGATAVLLAAAGALLLDAAPVWWVLALLLAAAAASGSAASWTARVDLHGTQVTLGVAALVLSWSSEGLTLVACLVLLPLGVVHHLRGTGGVRLGGGLVATLLLGGATWTGGALAQAPATWTALVVLLVVSTLVVASGVGGHAHLGIESGAAAVAAAAALVGVGAASDDRAAAWLAVHLTVAGGATTLVALTRPGRRSAGWAGGLLLAAATWVRLAEAGVSVPEAYTLPSAVALLAAGWYRTRSTTAVSTLSAWSPGLGLALVPSLVLAMGSPVSVRALLLGLACFALAVSGAQHRVAAPLAWGAAVGAVLVLWEVVPPAVELSAWLVTGVTGAALLVLGASWERRVSEARAAFGYLQALR